MPSPYDTRVRSYVLRQGRISKAQQRACVELLPRYGIPYAPNVLDLNAAFGRRAPKILEIGFGMGEATAAIAEAHPSHDYLGIEVHTPGVGSLLKLLQERGLDNVRVIQHDAVEVLRDMIESEVLAGVHVFFPDPWPKKRHHKRRLIQPEFAALVASRLETGGYLHCATDWEDYANQILRVLSAEPMLGRNWSALAAHPGYRPATKFETRGLGLGHAIWDVIFHRHPDR